MNGWNCCGYSNSNTNVNLCDRNYYQLILCVLLCIYIFAEYFIERHILCTILFVFDSVVRFVHCAGYLYYVQKFMSRCRYCKFVDLFHLVFSLSFSRYYYYSFSHRSNVYSFFHFNFDVLLGNSQIFQAHIQCHTRKRWAIKLLATSISLTAGVTIKSIISTKIFQRAHCPFHEI